MDIDKHTHRPSISGKQPAEQLLRQMIRAARDEGNVTRSVIVSRSMGNDLGFGRYGELDGVIVKISELYTDDLPILVNEKVPGWSSR